MQICPFHCGTRFWHKWLPVINPKSEYWENKFEAFPYRCVNFKWSENAGDLWCTMSPWLLIPSGINTLHRAHTISTNHWVWNHCLDSLGSRVYCTLQWVQPCLSNSYPHRTCNFCTFSSRLNSNPDDQYTALMKWFRVQDLTELSRTTHPNAKKVAQY